MFLPFDSFILDLQRHFIVVFLPFDCFILDLQCQFYCGVPSIWFFYIRSAASFYCCFPFVWLFILYLQCQFYCCVSYSSPQNLERWKNGTRCRLHISAAQAGCAQFWARHGAASTTADPAHGSATVSHCWQYSNRFVEAHHAGENIEFLFVRWYLWTLWMWADDNQSVIAGEYKKSLIVSHN